MTIASPPKKSTLFTLLLPTRKEQSAYFSLAAAKHALTAVKRRYC